MNVRSAMVSRFCVRPTSKRPSSKYIPKWPWNTIHSTPRRNPCRLYTHPVAFTHSIGPSSAVWRREPGPAPPFPPTRVLEKCNNGHETLSDPTKVSSIQASSRTPLFLSMRWFYLNATNPWPNAPTVCTLTHAYLHDVFASITSIMLLNSFAS